MCMGGVAAICEVLDCDGIYLQEVVLGSEEFVAFCLLLGLS